MFNYNETLQALRGERASMEADLDKINRAISALKAVVDQAAPTKAKRRLSIKRRREISQSQNAKKTTIGMRSKISAQGLRNIVEAQKKRWAKVRAAKAKWRSSAKKGSEPPATR